ncbi:MAG: polyribonucleotide nucleotidyltransferase [Bacteroidetes bacterium CG12_big_fil_rev_8_21_14_0_65_60_17]|nr:MAG: polyribonucleotide nucleotidyltransferase [Bacteroidetes bacterium CG12_big_fil_rev_8_21_14_0_65_60_17]
MSEATIREIEFAPGKVLSLETGRLAKQASGAVVARMGDTMVLCTVVVNKSAREGQPFFPLTVEYREKFSAAGKFPGGFIKREGRPTDKEVLTCRLIDRPVRPLFPDGFMNEVQIIASVISADDENDADMIAAVGSSAALMLSGAPFAGPIAEVRVGRVDGQFIVNPSLADLEDSDMNLVIAGKHEAIVMVEGDMDEASEDDMLEAFDVGHEAIKKLCALQQELVIAVGGVSPMEYSTVAPASDLVEKVRPLVTDRIAKHIHAPYDKESFYGGMDDIKASAVEALLGEGDDAVEATEEGWSKSDIKDAVSIVEKDVMREMILAEEKRIDGRGLTDVRNIWCDIGYLPRVHGSAIFTRGETQVLSSVTLGTGRDVQAVDQVFDQTDRSFYLHYSFPPFCTGEAKFLRGASRREIGHGYLAERALAGMLPDEEEFPYTIRINSDVLESNGSSSMASVCSGSMAMMDAGVPMRKPVSGIAMGLISDGQRVAVLSDILGTEDHLGDMDFKVTGTRDGVTACQMDIKIDGLSRDVMAKALHQARAGRMHILDIMEAAIAAPREELSRHAPRLTRIAIDPSFIGAVIGPGGKIIQGIQRDTNTTVEITEEDGLGYVTIAAVNGDDAEAALAIIKGIVTQPEEGEEYEGTVRKVEGFGAIVEILPGKEGLLHVSELDWGYVSNVDDYVQVGDKIKVKLIEVRDDGKLRFSRKPFIEKPEGYEERPPRENRGGSRSRDGGGRGRDGGGRGRGGDRGGRR